MRKVFILYGVLIVAVLLLAFFRFRDVGIPFIGGQSITVNNQEIKLDIADSPEELQKGLSGRDNLPEDRGMLFKFEEKAEHGFWMKEMKFPIDIIFIDDGRVVDIKENVQPPTNPDDSNLTIYSPSAPANYVLELNTGGAKKYDIKVGDTIELP